MDFWPTLVAAVVALVTTQSLQIAAPNLQGEKTMRWDRDSPTQKSGAAC